MSWHEAQEFERAWWGDCTHTYGEESKQITYAQRVGLTAQAIGGRWPVYDMLGASVIDIGGGPVSMLLKAINVNYPVVLDPGDYPKWIGERYRAANIGLLREPAEYHLGNVRAVMERDECWIYNTLQHVQDPEKVLHVARRVARRLRIFEWIDMPAYEGHPHELRAEELCKWMGRVTQVAGAIEHLDENNCTGTAFYGVFDRVD